MFRRTAKVKRKTIIIRDGYSETYDFVIETYWMLFIPVYIRETPMFKR